MSLKIRRALISVSDKTGLAELARGLTAAGFELYSTGGTSKFLAAEGHRVHDVADYTGFPEMLDGRVKTLHPKVHGGILARHDHPEDLARLAEHGIVTFELVVINLYPFAATVSQPNATFDAAIENIDIGGPSLIRGAAKNHAFVTVATDPRHYAPILAELETTGGISLALRRRLAYEAFAQTAAYDQAISGYLGRQIGVEIFPERLHLPLTRQAALRYGENPHQQAALYRLGGPHGPNLVDAEQLNGKELSYNNLLDLDAALAMVRMLPRAACVVIKHNNPCGAAAARSLAEATRRAFEGDPASAFGSVLGFNRPVDSATAQYLATPGLFVEAIVAPGYEPAALEWLKTKPKWKSNVRLMQVGPLDQAGAPLHLRQIEGGLLVQEADTLVDPDAAWRVVTEVQPNERQFEDLRFAWEAVRHVKSNAIVIAENLSLWGVGAGQMSRVDATEIAIKKAGTRVASPVLASDAFFPFADSIDLAASGKVTAIIQPGGSKRDDEVIAACNRHRLAMIFTDRRHFRH